MYIIFNGELYLQVLCVSVSAQEAGARNLSSNDEPFESDVGWERLFLLKLVDRQGIA